MKLPYNWLSVIVAGSLLVNGCAASATPVATRVAATPQATPTARILTRADLPLPALPNDRDEINKAEGTPNYDEVIRAMPRVGSPAPDFSLRTLDGVTVTLRALQGRPVLINFWASWCLPCREEAPELQRLYEEYQDRGLVILGVNVTQQDTLVDARAYVSEFKITFPIPLDENGEAMRAFRVPGLPTSFFVDRLGIIRNVVIGKMDWATMLEGLELSSSLQLDAPAKITQIRWNQR